MNSIDDELAGRDPTVKAERSIPAHSGRRPGEPGTREAIRAAAARLFAKDGYARTSMRAIASEAAVDQKLVAHYFGSKQELFVEVFALPFDPAAVVPQLLSGDRADVGRRFATFVVAVLEDPRGRERMLGLIRAAATEPAAAAMVRELIDSEVLARLAGALDIDDAPLRATLVASHVVGLAMARYIISVEPLVSMSPGVLIATIAPAMQRYLVEPLPGRATSDGA